MLGEYRRKMGRGLLLPLSAEKIGQWVFDLNILWEDIPMLQDSTRLAKLDSKNRIILNQLAERAFVETPGLHNTTLAHEVGHRVLHVDTARDSQMPLRDFICLSQEGKGEPDYPEERQAHMFMAYLLMPYELLRPAIETLGQVSWRGLYNMANEFDVTISAMRIRLERLGVGYVDANGILHASRAEANGQIRLL